MNDKDNTKESGQPNNSSEKKDVFDTPSPDTKEGKQRILEKLKKLESFSPPEVRDESAVETKQKLDEKDITEKIYREIKAIDNEKIKKLFELKGEDKKKTENRIIERIVKSI